MTLEGRLKLELSEAQNET